MGVLAEHPRNFRHSDRAEAISTLSVPYNVTNRGISIELPICWAGPKQPLALLVYRSSPPDGKTVVGRIGIPLSKVKGNNIFVRSARKRLHIISDMAVIASAEERHIYLIK